jgi:hypothetical protein
MRVQSILNSVCFVVLFAALTPSALSQAPVASCPAPIVEATSEPGGRLQFKIQSRCRKGEFVYGRYGELFVIEKLDKNGNLAFQLDCFLGDLDIEVIFADNWRVTGRSCSTVEQGLTKVAIVWKDRIDLDLFASEYSPSTPGSEFRLSAQNPGSYETARLEYSRFGRSYGYMSTVSDGQQLGHNVEVYTLLRYPTEPRGLISMAIGLGSQRSAAGRESCGDDHRAPIRVDVDVYVLERGTELRRFEREFATQLCNGRSSGIATNLIPNIRLGNPLARGTSSAD